MPGDKNNNKQQEFAAPVSLQGVGISISTMLIFNFVGAYGGIHPTNVIAAAAVKENVNSFEAAIKVYRGLGENPKNTVFNFFKGTMPHHYKESARALARAPGLAYLHPYLQTQFSSTHSILVFAGLLSCYEMIINAFDAKKSKIATGQKFELFSKDAFAGSFGNGARIFSCWLAFMKANEVLNPELKRRGKDPDSLSGMVSKLPFQSLAWTSSSYTLECILRRLQVSQEKYKPKSMIEVGRSWLNYTKSKEPFPKSVYLQVAKDVVISHGIQGLFYGFAIKLLTNAGLSFINNAVPVVTKKAQNYFLESNFLGFKSK